MEDLQQKVLPTQKKSESNNQKKIDLSLGAFDKALIHCETLRLNYQCNCNNWTKISKQPQQYQDEEEDYEWKVWEPKMCRLAWQLLGMLGNVLGHPRHALQVPTEGTKELINQDKILL